MDDDNTNDIILFNKEGFHFSRIQKNNYKLEFCMENNYIVLPKIVDFNLIKLIYDLNNDVYENVEIEKLNDCEVVATILMKHLFEDLGLPQRFSFIRIKKTTEENKIIFTSQSIKSYRPTEIPENAVLMSIEELIITCYIISPHNIQFIVNVKFDPIMNIPNFIEKIIGVILHKVFKRVKQFIEKVRI